MSATGGAAQEAQAAAGDALPEGFADLAPWLGWALEPERARTAKRVASSMEDIRAFYDAALPRLEAMIRHLEDFRDGEMPPPEHRLYLIALSLVEVANLVELYKRPEAIEACDPLRYRSQR